MSDASRVMKKYRGFVITSCVKKLEPLVVADAKGARVRNTDSNEYLDCFSGISVVNAGHCNPKVVEASKRQLDQLIHACAYVYHIPVVAQLAERLAQINPWG